jgi:hypothetical protein
VEAVGARNVAQLLVDALLTRANPGKVMAAASAAVPSATGGASSAAVAPAASHGGTEQPGNAAHSLPSRASGQGSDKQEL